MFIKPRRNGDTQCIFGGFYQPHIRNMEVIINLIVEGPQSGTNTIIRADFMN